MLRPQDKQGSGCGKEEILTNEELVKKIQAGEDPDGRLLYELYDQNRGLIAKVINNKGYTEYAEMEDLMQESFFAVHKAAFRWREGAGSGFPSYLASWVRSCLGRYVENFGGPVRIPVHRITEIKKYSRYVSGYVKTHGRKPSDHEIMKALGVTVFKLDVIRRDMYRFQNMRSLDTPAGEDGESIISDFVRDPSDQHEQTLERVYEEEQARAVWGAVDQLKDSTAEIIRLRYGRGLTIEEAGAAAGGLSKDAVAGRIKRGLNELRTKHFRELSQFADMSDVYSRGVHTVSVAQFQREGMSSTEWAALKEIKIDEELKRARREHEERMKREEERIEALLQYWKQRAEEQQREKECRDSVNLSPDPVTEA